MSLAPALSLRSSRGRGEDTPLVGGHERVGGLGLGIAWKEGLLVDFEGAKVRVSVYRGGDFLQ